MRLLFLFVLGTFLVSSSGIVLHKHYCSKDGVTITWKPFNDYHCSHLVKEKSGSSCTTSCCVSDESSSEPSVPRVEKSCCFDEFSVLSLEVDLGLNYLELLKDYNQLIADNTSIFSYLFPLNRPAFQQRPPPNLSLDYLALFQRYLI